MTIKDLDSTGDKDTGSKEGKVINDSASLLIAKVKGTGETEVKNAHATGDGSYGRNDESLPDGEEKKQSNDSTY